MSDEQLEDKNIKKIKGFFNKKIKKLILLFIVCVVASILFIFNEKKNKAQNIELSENYNKAKILIQQNKKDQAKKLLLKVIDEKNLVYSPLSLFLILDTQLIENRLDVNKLFNTIISINKLSEEDLNLIKIKKALFLMSYASEDQILELLNPIINKDSIWKNTALELLANYFLSKGEKQKSDEYFTLLKID